MPSNHNVDHDILKGNSKVIGYESSRSKADITLDTDPDLFDQNFCTTNIQKSFATLQYTLSCIDICIQAMNYNTIVLKALPYKSSIADIKQRIALQECLPKQYQVLKWNNQILQDDISLQALILSKSSSPLLLELKPMSLVVHTNFGDDIEIKTLTCFDTIKHVKDMIRDYTGIEKELQTLLYRDGGDIMCDDTRLTLPTLDSKRPLISGVKDLLSLKTEMCTELQILIFNGEELRDDDCLADYGIENGSEIQLECREETPALSVCAHDQGRRSVCYAYAIATVLRAAENRIIGRNPPKHNVIANQLIRRYGENGAVSSDVLRIECSPRRLRWKVVSKESTTEPLDRGHVLLGAFRLDDGQWKRFCAFFEDKRTKSQVIRKVDIGKRDGSKDIGHAVAICKDGGDYWRIKNSWGVEWGDRGFCKIGKDAIQTFKVYHVFYVQQDLTHNDLVNYQKFVKAA
eukprot:364741_1